MSRGFVKEDDQEEAPMIPPRAALPAGVTNYVTSFGYKSLLEERGTLENELKNLTEENETERRRATAVIDGKLHNLNERIASARMLDPKEQAQDQVRFGAVIELKNLTNKTHMKFQIVGVDEADVKQQKIAFIAPIARAVIGKKAGETAEFILNGEVRLLEVLSINYS